jgi:hypothetical protein
MFQNYRSTDPPTSVMAGQFVNRSGVARVQREMCFDAVQRRPGLTAREIEAELGIKAHKRLPELRHAGLIDNGPMRTCTVSERQALTWHVTPNPKPVNGDLA